MSFTPNEDVHTPTWTGVSNPAVTFTPIAPASPTWTGVTAADSTFVPYSDTDQVVTLYGYGRGGFGMGGFGIGEPDVIAIGSRFTTTWTAVTDK